VSPLELLAVVLALASAAACAGWLSSRRSAERAARRARERAAELEQRLAAQGEENARHRLVFAAMAEGVLVVDAARRVLAANPAAERLLDAPARAVGRPLLEVVRNARLADAVDRALAGAGPQEEELELSRPAEGERALRLRVVAFPGDREPEGVVAVLHDETPVHRLERVRRDFVVGVSHEFRTPFTAIRGFAETLAGEGVPPEKQREFARIIVRHAERLEHLLADLLTLAEIEARRRPLELGALDAAELARDLVRQLGPRLEAKRLRVEVAAEEPAPLAWADTRALEHVLLNLLDNAIKYTEAGGRIDIGVRRSGERVELAVADTGIGIPSRDLPRIFERFYRVDRARTREAGGSGLGLSLVKNLVELLGGEVRAESEPGRGSVFRVFLPAA
jgi:two-component system phosphate regulon sensor histidine kinase PhoR